MDADGPFNDLPISDYYKPHIQDVRTFMRNGKWWRAAVLIRDPTSGNLFMSLYLWERRQGEWKRSSAYTIRRKADAIAVRDCIEEFLPKLQ